MPRPTPNAILRRAAELAADTEASRGNRGLSLPEVASLAREARRDRRTVARNTAE